MMGALTIDPARHGMVNDLIPLMVFSSKGSAMTFNRAARRLLGVGKQSGLSPDLHTAGYAILDEAGRKYRQERLPWIRALRLKRAVRGVVCRFVMPNGSMRWFDVTAVPIQDSQGGEAGAGSAVCKLTDITSLKGSQDHLLDDLRLSKILATCYSRAICLADACPDCRIFRSVLGMAAKRLGPAGRLFVFENHQAADNGLCARCICCVTAQSNRNMCRAEMHVAWKAMPSEWHARLSMGKQVVVESRTPEVGRAFLDRIRLPSCVLKPMLHAREWIGFIAVGDALPGRLRRKECLRLARKVADATCSMMGYKRVQIRRLQAQKMEMLGTVSTGIAHDFNNILANIRGALQVALLEHPKNPVAIADTCREIDHEINEATELVRQLMVFGAPPRTSCQWLPVNERIRLIARLIRRMISKRIVLETDLPPFETVVRLDPSRFTRVLMNLILNARDAMPHGGKLNIRVSWVRGSEIVSPSARIRCDRHYVCIKVADTGGGIAPAALKHLFEPFYTTKQDGQGTGLGLSIVQSILHRSRGCVTVESKESQGTTFRCYLPGKRKHRPAK